MPVESRREQTEVTVVVVGKHTYGMGVDLPVGNELHLDNLGGECDYEYPFKTGDSPIETGPLLAVNPPPLR